MSHVLSMDGWVNFASTSEVGQFCEQGCVNSREGLRKCTEI